MFFGGLALFYFFLGEFKRLFFFFLVAFLSKSLLGFSFSAGHALTTQEDTHVQIDPCKTSSNYIK